ncbi:hypothetical protein B0J17DRAFT_718506 [Rhizoctonia solani]|nr:hypothetical protein B0J17DRAFT_718506 [Rhizoctonia solani]
MPDRVACLGVSYTDRFKRLSQPEDLEKAIEHYLRTLVLTPDGHSGTPDRFASSGVFYTNRFQRPGRLEDLEKSIEHYPHALALTPSNDAHDLSHLQNSLDSFRSASQLLAGAPRDTFQHAIKWAKIATKLTLPNLIEAYQVAIDLLPHFTWDLLMEENLAVAAAAVAARSSQHMLALEWLEYVRCVVWNQSLMLRSPVDQLRASHPDLAAKLQTIANQLHSAGSETQATKALALIGADYSGASWLGKSSPGCGIPQPVSRGTSTARFKDFLQPMKAGRLTHAAQHGPITVINCYEDRCDVLLVLPGKEDISHSSLPNPTEKKVQHARAEMVTSLRHKGIRERGVRPRQQPGYKDRFESVLAMLWDNIVKPVLGSGVQADRSLIGGSPNLVEGLIYLKS